MKNQLLKILFIGDIVGKPGRRAVCQFLSENKKDFDFIFANGENLAAGKGMTYEKYAEMVSAGVDYFTSGNHIWNNADFIPCLNDPKVKVLRPANYPAHLPGRGHAIVEIKGFDVLLLNLQGRVFMKDDIDDPFIIGKNIADKNKDKIILVDFHAEATSEKAALSHYLDGKVAAVLGTHTHVQTADEQILENGTAFISDIGMCGPKNSVLGVKKEIIIEKFLTQSPLSHKVAGGDSQFNAVILTIDAETKKTLEIKRISKIIKSN